MDITTTLSRTVHVWALLIFLLALVSAYCFGQVLAAGLVATSVLLFGDWLFAMALLVFLRQMDNGGTP